MGSTSSNNCCIRTSFWAGCTSTRSGTCLFSKGKLTVKQMRRFIAQALKEYGDSIVEVLPDGLLGRYKLLPRYEALRALHFPVGQEDLKQARRRFVYEEFFLFQLKMQTLRKMERENSKGTKKEIPSVELQEFIDALPFPLTGARAEL